MGKIAGDSLEPVYPAHGVRVVVDGEREKFGLAARFAELGLDGVWPRAVFPRQRRLRHWRPGDDWVDPGHGKT